MVDTFSCELFSSPCWVEKDRVPPLTGCSHPPKMNPHRGGGFGQNMNFTSNAPCKSRSTIDLRDIVCSRDDDQARHRYRRCLDCAKTPPQPSYCSCASSEDDAGPRPDLGRRFLTGEVKFAYKVAAAAAPGRRRSRCSGGGGGNVWWRRLWLVAAVCLVIGLDTCAAHMMPQTDLSTHREKGVCQSVDVRNDVQAFQRLSGCRVVEGFVQILLIDRADETSYDNVTFPELREITDYLLLYRVNGLRSVGKLFPNLAVIRGNTLLFNYAFISFEMIHLQEIGLHSLTDILRGGVRIEKNPLLCFVNTVDWDHIAKASKGEHYIKGNRQKNECPMCPTLSPLCPQASGSKDYLCWNNNYCQKVCTNCGDRTCRANGHDCCHESCLGGCSRANSSEDCTVCKGVLFQKKCIKSCPVNTYRYLNRRCILEQECLDMPVPREQVNDYRDKPWKAFNNTCILDCPHGYMEMKSSDGRRYQCEPCKGPCRKECAGVNVDSIASAQKLRGCTYIKGSLEIQIRGGKNIVKELEENLNMIEEIEGYLKIVRSFPLVSLNFLKNLKVIHGKELESHKYVFVVLDNQNLQELWDWSTRPANLQINKGRLFFHFNPKLCLYKIERLKHVANFSDFSDLDVARNSNGDKVACNVTALKVYVTQTSSQAVVLMWSQFDHYDPRSLLGYVVYSTEAPYQNVTLYDGRDACGADGWKVDDVHVPDNQSASVYHLLSRLKPYTQYAYYVKTYTIATERTGAQSPIYYFRTSPDIPSVPMSLQVFSNSSSSMVVTWQPPTEPNGNITHYIVSGSWERDDPKFLSQRNYCFDPLTLPEKKPTFLFPEKTPEKKSEEETCSCEEKTEPNIKLETEVLSQIDFEDTLHNHIYIKRLPQNRSKREVLGGDLQLRSKEHKEEKVLGDEMSVELTKENGGPNKIVNGIYESFEIQVNGTNMYVVTNLSHFAEYTIAVQACRERMPSENSSVITCSAKSIFTARTQALHGADNIDPKNLVLEVSNQTQATEVKLKWMEPPTPNGIIVTYHIMYTPVDNGDMKPQIECIPASEFQKSHKEYLLKRVAPGNYSIQVRATSLAGHGQYTPKRYIYIQDPSTPSGQDVWIGVLVGGGFVVLIIFGAIFVMRRNYKGVPNMKLIASVNPEYVNTVYVPDEWEVSRKKVEMLRELGQGSFGMVYEGIGHDIVEGQPTIRCAIKTVNEHATDRERSEFLNEASVMKAFNTHHVVRLLGVVSQGQPVLVIMELMAFGDLKSYLRSHRPDVSDDPTIQPPTLKRILQMAIEIADGMAYLSAKKFVHRDLAARNCMVAEDLTVKIGDFGMTRDIYETDYYRKGTKGLLPVRWMAPESLKDGVFTSFSDVWSYGVVLWEMATLASQPYQGLSNDQVLRYVIEGGVMERPENCPDKLYELMRQCWQHKTTLRPPFMELVSQLLTDISNNFAQVSFYHSTAGQEVRTQYAITMAPTSDDPSTPLRMTHDIEDFSLGGSDEDEGELDQEEEDNTPVPPTQLNPHYHSMSATQSQPSKMGNGSAVTTPTAPNGWISNNGSGTAAPANPTILMKTTEC